MQMKTATFLITLAALTANLSGASAQDIDKKPYTPIRATIGKAVTPDPALVAVASQIKEAVEAADAEAIFAVMAKEITFASSGITMASSRRVKKQPAFDKANAAMIAIGKHYQEGEMPGLSKADTDKIQRESALGTINDALEAAKWGQDPLLKGMVCTYRGTTWNVKTADKAGGTGSVGYHVTKPVVVRAKPDDKSKALGILKPGALYVQGFPEDSEAGWAGIRLPDGQIGHAPEADLLPATTNGLCFSKGADGKWKLAAFSSATL